MNSFYQERPWLKFYSTGIPDMVDIPVMSVGEAFNEATEKWKRRTAIIFYGAKISFQELRNRVDRLATALFELGIRKGDRIAFLLLNSPEHIIAFHASAKIGAIVTPLSPVYVSSEMKAQLEDSEAEYLICQDILYEIVSQTDKNFRKVILTNIAESLPVLKKFMTKSILRGVYQKMAMPSAEITMREGFHRLQDLIKEYPPQPPAIEIDPKKDVLTLPYTGGTTGQPRGVMLTHYNVLASFAQYRAFYPFFEDGKETIIAYMPFYHAAGQATVLVSALLQGWTSVIFTTPDLDMILEAITTRKASNFTGAPTVFEMLKDYDKTHSVNWKRLKMVCSCADALHESTARDWKERTGTVLHDLYGMTELTGLAAGSPRGKERFGSVGLPLPSTMIAIADPEKNEYIPPGDIGELVVSGPQVCLGYWNNPEATSECEAFIDDIKWWRTGDLGRMDKDGYLYLYDRKRDLIKYKGLRVHAREVEEVLKIHPYIREAGVIGVPDIKVGEKVKVFIVLQPDARGKISEDEITQYCQGKLTAYKIPKIIEFVGEIPKTDVGKVSRKELREMEEL